MSRPKKLAVVEGRSTGIISLADVVGCVSWAFGRCERCWTTSVFPCRTSSGASASTRKPSPRLATSLSWSPASRQRSSGDEASRTSGSPGAIRATPSTSRSPQTTAPPSTLFTRQPSRRAGATTAVPGSAPSTIRATTAPSFWIPIATTSKLCAMGRSLKSGDPYDGAATRRITPQEEGPALNSGTDLAIETSDLVKAFGDTRAVDSVDLAVPTGVVYGLLGPNGAGKTTVIRMLATLLRPDSGAARVLGHDVVEEADSVRARVSLTGQENLVLIARLLGYSEQLFDVTAFPIMFTGMGLNTDISKGVFDRFRSLPIWRPATLVGALLGDAARYAMASAMVIVLGLVLGFRPAGGAAGVLLSVALVLVFSFGLSWIWTALGLILQTPNSVMMASFLILFPLTFASNIFVDPETMPSWLQAIVGANPITHLVTAVRGLMHGTVTAGAIGWVLLASGALVAAFAPLTMYLYRNKK